DPLAPLLELAGVDDGVQPARHAVAAVHRHPTRRNGAATAAAAASARDPRASAALDGGAAHIPRAGEIRQPELAGAQRVAAGRGRTRRSRGGWSCWPNW